MFVNACDQNLILDIKVILADSPIADIEYKASSTNMKNIMNYLFVINEIHKKQFSSLTIKLDKLKEIEDFIKKDIVD